MSCGSDTGTGVRARGSGGERSDVERLVRLFYERAFQDDLLRHVFVDVVHMDPEAHIPLITSFWERVLLLTGDYSGRTMEVHRRVHAKVPLTEAHFTVWVELWCSSVRELHAGPVADKAQAHASQIAKVFLRNLSQPAPHHALPIVPGAA